MSVITKLHVLLDETIGLIRDTREFVQVRKLQVYRQPPDLFGPRGTEMRFPYQNQGANQRLAGGMGGSIRGR